MSSFIEKLKKGMQIEETPELAEPEESDGIKQPDNEEKKEVKRTVKKRVRKPKNEASKEKIIEDLEEIEEQKTVKETQKEPSFAKTTEDGLEKMKIEVKEEKPTLQEIKETLKEKKGWFEPEGQLTIDLYQTDKDIVVQSAVAGVKPEDLDITIEKDRVSIKGRRENMIEESSKNYFYQECYWGRFSREIIIPAEVDGSRADASIKEGVLTIRIPKIEKDKRRKIAVKR